MFRYRERFGLSYTEMISEPTAAIEQALFIWSLDSERDKLNSKRQEINSANG